MAAANLAVQSVLNGSDPFEGTWWCYDVKNHGSPLKSISLEWALIKEDHVS